jgi:hypothetical protein
MDQDNDGDQPGGGFGELPQDQFVVNTPSSARGGVHRPVSPVVPEPVVHRHHLQHGGLEQLDLNNPTTLI